MMAGLATLDYRSYLPDPVDVATSNTATVNQCTRLLNAYSRSIVSRNTHIDKDMAFGLYFAKLQLLQTDSSLCPEGAEKPQDRAIVLAFAVLSRLEDDMQRPSKVVASAEGGIAICFTKDDDYADIECFNDGAILGVTSNRRDRPDVWEIEPSASGIARASIRIRSFFSAQASHKDDPGRKGRR
jgi:hypothetical protein